MRACDAATVAGGELEDYVIAPPPRTSHRAPDPPRKIVRALLNAHARKGAAGIDRRGYLRRTPTCTPLTRASRWISVAYVA